MEWEDILSHINKMLKLTVVPNSTPSQHNFMDRTLNSNINSSSSSFRATNSPCNSNSNNSLGYSLTQT